MLQKIKVYIQKVNIIFYTLLSFKPIKSLILIFIISFVRMMIAFVNDIF